MSSPLLFALVAMSCGGTEADVSGLGLDGIEKAGSANEDGTAPPKDGKDGIGEKDAEAPCDDHGKDPVGTDPSPVVACADKGLACAVILDKSQLCAGGEVPYWDLACGDGEVCCGPAFEDPVNGCTDPSCEK